MKLDSKIFITGHLGLVGSALLRELLAQGYTNLLTTPRSEVDLTNSIETQWYFSCVRPDYVFHCAARVGGIKANVENRLSFFLENSIIQQNVFRYAAQYGVKRLLFLGYSIRITNHEFLEKSGNGQLVVLVYCPDFQKGLHK